MNLALRPELERFIVEEVSAGRFPTPEAVVEAALAELQHGAADLDDDTLAAINEAESQADRGEGMELDEFRAKMEKRFAGN